MDVMRKMREMPFLFQQYRFEFALKEGADAGIFEVEIISVAGAELAHKLSDAVSLFLSHHEMIVVGHEAK